MVSSLLSLCLGLRWNTALRFCPQGIISMPLDFITSSDSTLHHFTSHVVLMHTHTTYIHTTTTTHTHTRHHNTPGISDTTYIAYYFWMKGSTYGIKDKIATVYPLKKPGNSHFFPDICMAFFSVKNLCLCMNCMINECSSVVNYEITGNTDNKTKSWILENIIII